MTIHNGASVTVPDPTLAQIVVHSALHGGGLCPWSPRAICPEYFYTAPRVMKALTEAGFDLRASTAARPDYEVPK